MESFLRAQSPIDLHMHSNRSDGTDSPSGVVREAHAHGVRTMALTDHDMFDGWAEAEAECLALGMTFIPGAELSTTGGPGIGGMHLLAYLFDPLEPQLASALLQVTGGSESRIRQIVERLQEDYDIDFDDVAPPEGAPGWVADKQKKDAAAASPASAKVDRSARPAAPFEEPAAAPAPASGAPRTRKPILPADS
jgi:hypothetical protein